MLIRKQSTLSRKMHTLDIDITQEQLEELQLPPRERRYVQDICPNLNADDREFLISGITKEEWNDTFK